MLRIAALHKRYGSAIALDGVSFEVNPGEIVALLGPNGAGKTTTLECVLGLRRPDAGAVTIDGVDVDADPQRARQRVGAQLQSTALQDKITPRQALRLFGNFYSAPLSPQHLLERFSLTGKADARFDTLSAGQRQRLGVALAFVNDPQLLVLDEPTAGLDPHARRDLAALLQAARADGRAVLFSTHSLEEAESWCDRVIILHHGRVVASGTPSALIDAAAARPRLFVRLDAPAELMLSEAIVIPRPNAEYGLASVDLSQTLLELARCLAAQGRTIIDLRMIRPSLEEVFVECTGNAWEDEEKDISRSPLPPGEG